MCCKHSLSMWPQLYHYTLFPSSRNLYVVTDFPSSSAPTTPALPPPQTPFSLYEHSTRPTYQNDCECTGMYMFQAALFLTSPFDIDTLASVFLGSGIGAIVLFKLLVCPATGCIMPRLKSIVLVPVPPLAIVLPPCWAAQRILLHKGSSVAHRISDPCLFVQLKLCLRKILPHKAHIRMELTESSVQVIGWEALQDVFMPLASTHSMLSLVWAHGVQEFQHQILLNHNPVRHKRRTVHCHVCPAAIASVTHKFVISGNLDLHSACLTPYSSECHCSECCVSAQYKTESSLARCGPYFRLKSCS